LLLLDFDRALGEHFVPRPLRLVQLLSQFAAIENLSIYELAWCLKFAG
jgi:hypothetical protein